MKQKSLFYTMLISGFMLLYSCKPEGDPEPVIGLGNNYGGGTIFYIDATKEHGLIASGSFDIAFTIPWTDNDLVATGATHQDGAINTTQIISVLGNSGSYAAKACKDYRGGGFNDWFLPSKSQLNLLYNQKKVAGIFEYAFYWSSTEESDSLAWYQDFSNGNPYINLKTSPTGSIGVVAIRKF